MFNATPINTLDALHKMVTSTQAPFGQSPGGFTSNGATISQQELNSLRQAAAALDRGLNQAVAARAQIFQVLSRLGGGFGSI